MNSGTVSCIIPAFNGERYLGEAIESILAQTYSCLEVIVVDDGSTDDTKKVATDFGKRVSYVRQNNSGPADAKNRGIKSARGDYFAFLDQDDIWHAEKIERQVLLLQERPEIDFCFTQFQHFWGPELAEEAERYKDHSIAKPLSSYLSSSLLVPRKTVDEYGAFGAGLRGNENMIWFFESAKRGAKIKVLEEVLTHRRVHGKNLTKEYLQKGEFFDDVFLPIVKAWRDYKRKESG